VLIVFYKTVVPLPLPPIRYAPIVLAVWLALGAGVLVWLRQRGEESWLTRAGRAFDDADAMDRDPVITGG
jgi:hypothetical protein